jgi:tripartite-type tricarboxylate transporter receptor subunit TctC
MTNIVLEHHRAGKLKVLAVTHGKRLAAAPELPTAVEQGFPDWWRRTSSASTPRRRAGEIVDAISAANLKLLADKSYQELLISGRSSSSRRSAPRNTSNTSRAKSRAGGRS